MPNYAFYRESGTGGAGSLTYAPDFFIEGTGSVSYKVQASWEAGILYDYYTANSNTALNMATGNRHLFLWYNILTAAFLDTDANNGVYIIATADSGTSGSPTNYARWVINSGPGGTASIIYPGGWKLAVLDMTKDPSSIKNTGCTVSSIRRLGIGITSITGTVKAENLYLDAMWYGVPNYKVIGDTSTTATWQDFIDDSATNGNGLIEDLGGAVRITTGIQFGDSTQTSTTVFSDATGTKLFYKRHIYRTSTGTVTDCATYSSMYKITADGTSSIPTSVQIGTVVGTGDDRQGVLGGGISSADTTNITWSVDFQTNIANISTLSMYGFDVGGAKGGVLFDDFSKSSIISCGFVNCGEIDPGTTNGGAEILNCAVIDPYGLSNNRGIRLTSTHHIKKISAITSGTPSTQHMFHFPDAGTYDVTCDATVVYGDFSSGTLWHGEASANNSGTITMAQSNGSNQTTTEIATTGTPPQVMGISTSLTLKMIVKDSDGAAVSSVFVYIDNDDSSPFILNTTTDTNGEASVGYTEGAVSSTRWRARKYGYRPFKQLIDIGSDDITLPITLVVDPQQT